MVLPVLLGKVKKPNEWELEYTVVKKGRRYRTTFFVNKDMFKSDRKRVEESIGILFNMIEKYGVEIH